MNRNQGMLAEYRRNIDEYTKVLSFLRDNGFIYFENSKLVTHNPALKRFLITSKSKKYVTRLLFLYKRQENLL